MAKAERKTTRGRNQDRARVAGGQDYEVRYEAKKPLKGGGEESGQEGRHQPQAYRARAEPQEEITGPPSPQAASRTNPPARSPP